MSRGFRITQGKCLNPYPREWGMPNTRLCKNAMGKACRLPLGSPTPTIPWVLGPSDWLCFLGTPV